MKWFDRFKKERYKTYSGIARVTQINDTVVELNEEITHMSEGNTEVEYTPYDGHSIRTSSNLLSQRASSDTSSYLAVQTQSRLTILEILKAYKLQL
jgi:hypothetical protein